ncbi:hypothetical protein RRG08_009101 [Elysia crispata]|uniref:Uncharacterized protein n=1 Tax=Elysia crispata TaxID=231223 RepID=A0AAE0YYT2_9GAST|nr:hypothetical protein RRG08_009101 [Elysia crispata]
MGIILIFDSLPQETTSGKYDADKRTQTEQFEYNKQQARTTVRGVLARLETEYEIRTPDRGLSHEDQLNILDLLCNQS